ncbi:sigma-70 family RNA polymerase sigma factor [Sphingopyxis sp.]|uniref:sigma-70 family RNA polymerase sigma factor n=1 Tax=Sphingopyxis sp. TaxID=1908224 RepID=UPI002B49ABE4|nr:sigma-70 family RNA polymerase sigma factor [Sphingopyxis sp.]HJS09998.1 sigma-70 family RNA polymerase sigma factor [Sphingopyxis sp.]
MMFPGSVASFDAFYRSQNERLFHYFRKRAGRDAAPDLVQEAFTRMLRCGAFERVENPQAYLTRTAHNLLIERARHWQRKQSTLCPLDEGRDAPVQPEQEWRIEAAELRRIFRRALRAMPRRTRRIFLMHRLRGMSYREIGERLGIGDKAVEYHMMRALARCRRAAAARCS